MATNKMHFMIVYEVTWYFYKVSWYFTKPLGIPSDFITDFCKVPCDFINCQVTI